MSQKSTIVAFQQDKEQYWIAELSCGHRQHVRHRPPFVERQWVLTESGRAAKIGYAIVCGQCELEAKRYRERQ